MTKNVLCLGFVRNLPTAASTWWCGPWPHLGWFVMAVGLPEVSRCPGHSPRTIFSPSYPLNDRRRAAHSFLKIGRLSSPFFCLFLARLRLVLLLLMSGNVHPNPGFVFSCCIPPLFNQSKPWLLQLVYLHCSIWPPSANAALPPHPRLQSSYPPSAHFVSSSLAESGRKIGFFNGMLAVSEPGALNCYTLSCLIPLNLFVSKNLTLTHLPLSGSLGSLLCN